MYEYHYGPTRKQTSDTLLTISYNLHRRTIFRDTLSCIIVFCHVPHDKFSYSISQFVYIFLFFHCFIRRLSKQRITWVKFRKGTNKIQDASILIDFCLFFVIFVSCFQWNIFFFFCKIVSDSSEIRIKHEISCKKWIRDTASIFLSYFRSCSVTIVVFPFFQLKSHVFLYEKN